MTATVLIVDDEDNARFNISSFLVPRGYEVIGAANLAEAREVLKQGRADIILLDVLLPDGYGPNLLYETSQLPVKPPIILITAHGDIDMAVEAMKNGAHDFIQKPIQLERLEKSIQRAGEVVSMRRELAHLRTSQYKSANFIVGQTREMQQVVNLAQRAANVATNILITGETGTGKEVLAQYIHKVGTRAIKPFIPINCAAIQTNLLESELFGFEAGAFTGAERRKNGLMEIADTGILFLDEISSMSLDIQAKLLRAIEEHEFRRVGGINLIRVDVQVLAASNKNLPKLIEDGQFREDLYYRLKVVDIHLPPLRERKIDIPDLVGLFIRQNNPRMGLNIIDISSPALQALIAYKWPGNIRELANTMERAMLFCDEAMIDVSHLPFEITGMLNK
jgi:DNA-binding NtrC family response regulator